MPLKPLTPHKNPVVRILGFFCGLISATFLFSLLMICNVLQTLSLLLKPFSSAAFRKANREIANAWWSLCYLMSKHIYRIDIEITGDDIPEKENVVLVSNHQEMPDIPVLFKLAYQKKRLGDLKWYVKDVFKFVPGVGWGMLFLDCIFVKRNWASDRAYIESIFDKFLRYKIPIWVISFVEGTRMRPKKLERSNQYAEKNGMTPTKHVILPRTKGFVATVQALREHLDAVYDVSIGYVDGVPNLWQLYNGQVRKVHLHVRRFPVQDIPEDDTELGDWLTDRFYKKDDLFESFYQEGRFVEEDNDKDSQK